MGKSKVGTTGSVLSSDFDAWLRVHHVIAHGIQAAFVAEGWRGIAATEDISAGAPLTELRVGSIVAELVVHVESGHVRSCGAIPI